MNEKLGNLYSEIEEIEQDIETHNALLSEAKIKVKNKAAKLAQSNLTFKQYTSNGTTVERPSFLNPKDGLIATI